MAAAAPKMVARPTTDLVVAAMTLKQRKCRADKQTNRQRKKTGAETEPRTIEEEMLKRSKDIDTTQQQNQERKKRDSEKSKQSRKSIELAMTCSQSQKERR